MVTKIGKVNKIKKENDVKINLWVVILTFRGALLCCLQYCCVLIYQEVCLNQKNLWMRV